MGQDYVHTRNGEDDWCIQTKCLATDGVKVGKLDEVVIWDVGVVATLRLDNLCAKFLLDVRMESEKMESTREGVRCRVHPSEDEGTEAIRVS